MRDQDTALAEIGEERVREAFPVQYDLIGLAETPVARANREKRTAGRPEGARNKRSEDVARYVIEVLGDPLLHQAAVATMAVEDLATALGCTRIEALVEKRLAAAVVLPFLHRRMPLAISVDSKVVHLVIGEVGVAAGGGVDATVEVVGFQEVSDVPDAPV